VQIGIQFARHFDLFYEIRYRQKKEECVIISRAIVLFLLFTSAISILSGCADSITDSNTEKKIKIVQNPAPSLTKVKVETDGMASPLGYDHPHPFGMGNEVLVYSNYAAEIERK
jgi:hypothetical protein